MDKVRVGITIGDMNGVGLEVIIKSLANPDMINLCIPVIYGSAKVVSYHKNIVKPHDFSYQSHSNATNLSTDRINLVNCWNEDAAINLGEPDAESGKFAYIALDQATQDLKAGLIDVLITAPIDKHAMSLAGFPAPGHTEYLTEQFGASSSLMLMVADQLRIGVLSNHVPVSEVAALVTKELIIEKASLLVASLQMDFGIEKPLIGILGLNPHAGDHGLIGSEEEDIIKPAIAALKEKGMFVGGPYSADGFFGSSNYRKVDGILAMYHDQGLIPFKTLSFGQGVNYTAGLSIVRTSPDHGVGAAIAGKNTADERSFQQAMFVAMDVWRNRKIYSQDHQNKLKVVTIVEEEDGNALAEDF